MTLLNANRVDNPEEKLKNWRLALCGACTLNGRPATVSGSGWRFAMVRTADQQPMLSFEYAWETVEHVRNEKGGAFLAG